VNILDYIKNNVLYLDGGMGTLLHSKGLITDNLPEQCSITHPDLIIDIHKAYFDAGSNVVCTNTFGANGLKYNDNCLEQIIQAAVNNARSAAADSKSPQAKWVALDIGPLGKMMSESGDLQFEDAVKMFSQIVKIGVKYGVDLICIETMYDSLETKAALFAVKSVCDLPVFVSNTYGRNGKLLTGASPEEMVAMLESMGADVIGVNCSFGPQITAPVVRQYLQAASVPVLFKPSAGLPRIESGRTVYEVMPVAFASLVAELIKEGVTIAGGCCGTTPVYIKALIDQTGGMKSSAITYKDKASVLSEKR